jgi:hypothetical protein
MSCGRCEELHVRVEIDTRDALAKAIRVIQSNLKADVLVQASRTEPHGSTVSCRSVTEGGPWEDVLLYGFCCRSCGAEFRFFVETHHGRGGTWQPRVPQNS